MTEVKELFRICGGLFWNGRLLAAGQCLFLCLS